MCAAKNMNENDRPAPIWNELPGFVIASAPRRSSLRSMSIDSKKKKPGEQQTHTYVRRISATAKQGHIAPPAPITCTVGVSYRDYMRTLGSRSDSQA